MPSTFTRDSAYEAFKLHTVFRRRLGERGVLKARLPVGFSSRPGTMEDIPAVLELINTFANHVVGQNQASLESIAAEWQATGFDPQSNVRLVETESGLLAGSSELWDTDAIPVDPKGWGNVHPSYEGLGIGSYLLNWAEDRAREVFPRVPPEARVVMRAAIYHGHQASVRLLLDHDFEIERHFWRMVIHLTEQLPAPRWPQGIQLRPYESELHAEAVYRAEDEAFKDHWGHVDEPFEEGFKRWSQWNLSGPFYDPSLFTIAWDGDQIAGIARCRQRADDDPEMGWVRSLSVRRPWRRRGLAIALLLHSFGELYRRGKSRAGLGVDAQNPTGAIELYEKAGMHVELQYDTFAKELRGGVDLRNLA